MSAEETSSPTEGLARRTIRRIVLEAIVVGLAGAFVFGLFFEIGHREAGWIAAVCVWIAGAPTLEILRLLGSDEGDEGGPDV